MYEFSRLWIVVCAVMASLSIGAESPSEAELLKIIESLQQRVDDLEAKVGELEQNKASREVPEEQAVQPEPSAAQRPRVPNEFRVFWDDGLRMATADEQFKFSIGGRIHIDHAWFDQDDSLRYVLDWDRARLRRLDIENGAEFRFARLHVKGLAYGNIEFQAEYDFADGDAEIKDTYIAYDALPGVGKLTVGHFKEPFSFDELTSDNDVTFMERALPNALVPGRNMGVSLGRTFFEDRLRYAAGVFRETDETGHGLDDGGYAVTARISGNPWIDRENDRLIHLGASYSWRDRDDTIRFSMNPEAHLSNWDFVDTGDFYAERVELFGLEAAAQYGPFWAQAEWIQADVDADFRGTPDFDGGYALASYVFTGEHREYDMEDGVIGGLRPDRPFDLRPGRRGWGAWELAVRASHLDLIDGFFRGGEERNLSVGLNWYLNANTRVRFNYVRADIDHDLYEGDLNIFQTRFQYHF